MVPTYRSVGAYDAPWSDLKEKDLLSVYFVVIIVVIVNNDDYVVDPAAVVVSVFIAVTAPKALVFNLFIATTFPPKKCNFNASFSATMCTK